MPKSDGPQQGSSVEGAGADHALAPEPDEDADFIRMAMEKGLAAFEEGEPGFARLHFDHAISRIRRTGKCEQLLPELIGKNGRALQRQKRWDQALECYKQAAAEADRQKLLREQLRWLGKEAKTLLDMNDRTKGLPLLEQSVEFARKVLAKDRQAAVELSELLGRLANEIMSGNATRAGELWKEAFQVLSSTDDPLGRFLAALNYARFLGEGQKPRQAQTYLEEALEIGMQAELRSDQLLNASLDLAENYRSLNACDRGGDYLLAQMPRFKEPQDQHKLLTAAVNCYFAGRLWTKMKATCVELRKLRQQGATPEGLYDVESLYSIACLELGEVDEALKALKAALKHATKWGEHEAIIKARGQRVVALNRKGDYQAAVEMLQDLWGKELTDSLTARTYVDALIALDDLSRAIQVRDQFKKSGGARGDVALLSARIAEASHTNVRQAWERVLRDARRNVAGETTGSSGFILRAEAVDHLLELYKRGSPKKLELARRRARMAEEIRWRVSDLFSDAEWRLVTPRAKDLPAYLDYFLVEAARAKAHEEALYELERFRSQSLVNVISERSNLWSGEEVVLEFKGRITNQYQRARYRFEGLTAMGAGWQARREAAERADELASRALTAEGVINLSPGNWSLHFPETLNEHLRHVDLAEGEALIFQRTLTDRTLIWLMEPDGTINHETLPDFTSADAGRMYTDLWAARNGKLSNRSMSREVGEFELSEEPVQAVDTLLSELDRKLAAPLAKVLEKSRVRMAFVISGTDVTNLPLDHCPSWRSSNIEVSFLPTARALGFARAPRYPRSERVYLVTAKDRRTYAEDSIKREEGRAVLVVDPTNSLQYSSLEAAVVALESGTLDLEILAGAAADEQAVSKRASHVGLLHLISHGTFDTASPYRSGMFMKPGKAADALWMVAEVFSDVAAPAGRLVVLSGCETGRTRPNLVSEEVSLPAAFLASGFAAVVASRWAVDDLSTSLLIGEFYRRWFSGKIGVSTAIRQASEWLRTLDKQQTVGHLRDLIRRLKLVKNSLAKRAREIAKEAIVEVEKAENHPFRDPKHWAAFYAVGDGAITATSFPSQKLSVPKRRRRPSRA